MPSRHIFEPKRITKIWRQPGEDIFAGLSALAIKTEIFKM
jgi:hypothetical protein